MKGVEVYLVFSTSSLHQSLNAGDTSLTLVDTKAAKKAKDFSFLLYMDGFVHLSYHCK